MSHVASSAPGANHPTEARLLISEIFGPTVQGEGLGLGLPAVFLRVAGCPLSCSWCDTAYAWDWSRHDKNANTRLISSREAWEEVLALADGTMTSTLVLTGGEPASQAKGLLPVVHDAKQAGWRVEMETSGAIDPSDLVKVVDLVTVSPKLSGAGMAESTRLRSEVLTPLSRHENVVWKFVIDSPRDLAEADELVRALGLRLSHVLVMAQATTAEEVVDRTRWLIPAAIERGYRVTPRLHTLLWGDERGR